MSKYRIMVSLLIAGWLPLVCVAAQAAQEPKGLSQKEYGAQFPLQDSNSRYWNDVRACLRNWGDHPFTNTRELRFRVIDPDVRIFGLGGNVVDTAQTRYPQLIYIRPAVSVMSKATYELLNDNGWYCFKAKVNVMSKSVIKAACNAHIVTTKGKTTVLGKGEQDKKGTTVMGKSVIERDCPEGERDRQSDEPAAPPAEDQPESHQPDRQSKTQPEKLRL